MKNLFSIAITATILLFGSSSCSKCANCTKSGGSAVRVCEKDYDSNTAYGLALDYYEASGYNCH